MWLKKCCSVFLVCAVMVGCLCMTAGAAEINDSSFELSGPVSRVSGALNTTISANSILTADKSFFMETGETVTINCSYTPASASVDFGLIDSDGSFYYFNITDGSINKTIQVNERGYYTLAVRNNSAYSVSVTGYVNY